MPGIVGIVGRGAAGEHERQLRTMLAAMLHEPTYVSGTQICAELGFYGGWVAHADSYAARQSRVNEQNRVALAFAGECFAGSGEPRSGARGVDLLEQYARETSFVAGLN